jgi:hypothetical protein
MDKKMVLDWLFSDLDELIDFDGYVDKQWVKKHERREHIETGDKHGGPGANNH